MRYKTIDYLRGISILAMVLIHTSAYFLDKQIAAWLWNVNEFAVQVFVFCSAYIFFSKEGQASFNFWPYLTKRFVRLLKPYYIFLLFFLPINYYLIGKDFNLNYLWQNLSLTGGVDFNWLVLLFLYFALLFPLIAYLSQQRLKWFYFIGSLPLISSIIFLFYHFPFNWKLIMWLPWSLLIFYAAYFVKYQSNKVFHLLTLLGSCLLFVGLYLLQVKLGHSLKFYDNKYPPNLYFLVYGTLLIEILYCLSNLAVLQVLTKPLYFLSRYSYQIYFVHIIVLEFVAEKLRFPLNLNWLTFFLLVFSLTILIQMVLNKLLRSSIAIKLL